AATLPTLDEALKSLESGEAAAPRAPAPANGGAPRPSGGASSAVSAARMPSANGGGQTMRLVEPDRPEPQAEPLSGARQQPEPEPAEGPAISSISDIVALADANRDMAFKVLLRRCVRPVRIQPGQIAVGLTEDAPRTLLNDLSAKLKT